MPETQTLKSRLMMLFALMAVAIPVILGTALWLAAQRMSADAVPHLVLFGGGAGFALIMLVGWIWLTLDDNVVKPVQGLSRELQTLVHANTNSNGENVPGRYVEDLAQAVHEVSEGLEKARRDVDVVVLEATSEMRAQKQRLESLLHDLNEGVILCNRAHHVLLYNHRALETLEVSGDVGLGRSLFSIVNRTPILNTFERLTNRYTSGRYKRHRDYLSAPMVFSTRDGRHILQGKMNLLLEEGAEQPISGYVLTLSDVTEHLGSLAEGERLLREAIDSFREPISTLRAAAETVSSSTDISPSDRERFDAIMIAEATQLSDKLDDLTRGYDAIATSHWPLSDCYSENLFSCVTRRYRDDPDIVCDWTSDPQWMRCDSNTIIELIDYLITQLRHSYKLKEIILSARANDKHTFVDIAWDGAKLPEKELDAWLAPLLEGRFEAMSGQDILQVHRTEAWSEDLPDGRARLTIPLMPPRDDHASIRPEQLLTRLEFYDFDLLNRDEATGEMRERRLRDLTYVVFDTETTGLEPSNGDEIVSIAGVRIVNNRVLNGERFDELVNPGRSIPQRSTVVHGISEEMVKDKPPIGEVLPRFRDYAADSVLVAHNAAFDMRFLELKEQQTGVSIDNPVLDTVLLSAIVHDHTDKHTLDAVAERFNVVIPPEVRHTALGDSLATAGVFVRIVELLEANGIHTLGDALEACDRIVKIRRQQSKY